MYSAWQEIDEDSGGNQKEESPTPKGGGFTKHTLEYKRLNVGEQIYQRVFSKPQEVVSLSPGSTERPLRPVTKTSSNEAMVASVPTLNVLFYYRLYPFHQRSFHRQETVA